MKNASLALLICLTSATLCASQEPSPAPSASEAKIVLLAPTSASVGELVRLDVSESIADSFEWLLVPNSTDFLVYDAGARACFSARKPGEYVFIVACAKGGTVDVIRHVIRVEGPPKPPPTPQTQSLSEWIPYWNWELELPKDQCVDVARVYREVAGRKAELNSQSDWTTLTAEKTRKVLGDNLEAWKTMLDKIGRAIQKRAEEKANLGISLTPDDYEQIWLEIARGLEAC